MSSSTGPTSDSQIHQGNEMNDQQWYYESNGGHVGPISWDRLIVGLKLGKINQETLVWASHLPGWIRLLECQENQEKVQTAKSSANFQVASDVITNQIGLDRVENFSIKDFFSEVFKKHDPNDVERQLSVGSLDTTPELHQSMTTLPSPWIFFRVLCGTIIAYLMFLFAWQGRLH